MRHRAKTIFFSIINMMSKTKSIFALLLCGVCFFSTAFAAEEATAEETTAKKTTAEAPAYPNLHQIVN